MSTERIVVQRSIADKFKPMLADAVEKLYGKQGPAFGLVAPAAVKKNKELVEDALAKGANLVYGDLAAVELDNSSMRPLIVGDVAKNMDMYTMESFGPTVSLIVVDSDEDAVALANDTEYGLTSTVFTGNLFRGLKVAKQIEAG